MIEIQIYRRVPGTPQQEDLGIIHLPAVPRVHEWITIDPDNASYLVTNVDYFARVLDGEPKVRVTVQ